MCVKENVCVFTDYKGIQIRTYFPSMVKKFYTDSMQIVETYEEAKNQINDFVKSKKKEGFQYYFGEKDNEKYFGVLYKNNFAYCQEDNFNEATSEYFDLNMEGIKWTKKHYIDSSWIDVGDLEYLAKNVDGGY